MSEFLLVVEGLAAGGADAALFVSEDTYKGAMFGCVFAEPVHGYVWCDRHGWVRSDEACVCDDCVWEALQAQAEALREQHAAEFGEDWLDEGDRGEMAYRRINAREQAEFPRGEFDDGAHWREPAQALSPLSPGQWACEPCGDPDDGTDRLTDEEEEDLFFYWLYDESGEYDPVGRCRCGGLIVTQPGTTRVVCVECGADYPESPGWEDHDYEYSEAEVLDCGLTEEEEAMIGAQVDAWSDRGMAWEDIVALEPRAMFLPTR